MPRNVKNVTYLLCHPSLSLYHHDEGDHIVVVCQSVIGKLFYCFVLLSIHNHYFQVFSEEEEVTPCQMNCAKSTPLYQRATGHDQM